MDWSSWLSARLFLDVDFWTDSVLEIKQSLGARHRVSINFSQGPAPQAGGNWFLRIDSWTHYQLKNSGSVDYLLLWVVLAVWLIWNHSSSQKYDAEKNESQVFPRKHRFSIHYTCFNLSYSTCTLYRYRNKRYADTCPRFMYTVH